MHNILYQVIQRHQTWWNGQNLKFHFLVEKWLSLGHLLRKKNRKSWKHVFYTNWTILSRKKNFSKKIFWMIQKKFFFEKSRKKIFFDSESSNSCKKHVFTIFDFFFLSNSPRLSLFWPKNEIFDFDHVWPYEDAK